MLSKEFIAQTRIRLLEDKKRLERDLENLATKDPKKPGQYVASYDESGSDSEDDNSMEITNSVDDLSLVKRLESELRDTGKALDSIEKGTYGICKYCSKEIDIKRLEARPTSSTCIDCKKLLTQEM